MIRIANLEDLNTIVSLKIQMFKDSKLDYLLSDNCEKIIFDKYNDLYRNKTARHFVYIIDNQIIAIAGAFIKDEIPYCFYKENKYGFIGDMYTLPKYRKQGIAQQLLDQTINWFKDNNINMVQLIVSEDGFYLYKKNGFTVNNEMMSLRMK